MKIFSASYSAASLALLGVQLALVSSVAGKYLYERHTCPRVWTRAAAVDPELVMRGRYLSLKLRVDGCRITLPGSREAAVAQNLVTAYQVTPNATPERVEIAFPARLTAEDGKLNATWIRDPGKSSRGQRVSGWLEGPCDAMQLEMPVDFYIPEHAQDPSRLQTGQELWIEVTVPPAGPPRPIQLALKQGGEWKPLAF